MGFHILVLGLLHHSEKGLLVLGQFGCLLLGLLFLCLGLFLLGGLLLLFLGYLFVQTLGQGLAAYQGLAAFGLLLFGLGLLLGGRFDRLLLDGLCGLFGLGLFLSLDGRIDGRNQIFDGLVAVNGDVLNRDRGLLLGFGLFFRRGLFLLGGRFDRFLLGLGCALGYVEIQVIQLIRQLLRGNGLFVDVGEVVDRLLGRGGFFIDVGQILGDLFVDIRKVFGDFFFRLRFFDSLFLGNLLGLGFLFDSFLRLLFSGLFGDDFFGLGNGLFYRLFFDDLFRLFNRFFLSRGFLNRFFDDGRSHFLGGRFLDGFLYG